MKILIIRLSSIGDIVSATPLIRCLRKKYSDAEIDFILKKQYSDILSKNPYISKLILFDGDIFKSMARISLEKYDLIVDIHGNFKSFLLTLFSKAKVLKYKNFSIRRFLLVEWGINLYWEKLPVSNRYLNAVKSLGINDDNEGCDFFIDENIKKGFGELLKGEYIGICPVSAWKTKRWLSDNYITVSRRISEIYECNILIFGGKEDQQYCENIRRQIGDKATNYSGFPLQETAAAIRMCKFLLTNDTGIMHIAEALKIPVVALFGPTVEEFGFYPQLKKSRIISKNFVCKPCSTKGSNECPTGSFICMKAISTGEVISNCASCL
ncbi:MAG: hypothetical protein A2539_07085 [Elusimicrobia bacterium RIFOXYD2_FULL_34_15]|nr:MAG: hypothetical protein A2539_07085 [Elusimicrobia bacterium RIFOXYD2_FULL_34_15]